MGKILNHVTGSVYRPKGSRYWHTFLYLTTSDGTRKPFRKTTKLEAKKKNLKEAERIMEERKRELEEMYNPAARDWYFDEFADYWYENAKTAKVRETSWASYEAYIKHIKEYFTGIHKIRLVDLTSKDLSKFYDYLLYERTRTLSLKTVKEKDYIVVHAILKYAVEDLQLIPFNPAKPPDLGVIPKKKIRFLEEKEYKEFLDEIRNTEIFAPCWLSLRFGLRRGEVAGLLWKNVDFDKKTLYICETEIFVGTKQKHEYLTKNDKSTRILSLTDKDITVLKQIRSRQNQERLKHGRKSSEEYVCTYNRGGNLKLNFITKASKRVFKKIGADDATFHSLRHTAASLMISSGMELAKVSKTLGHKSINTTVDTYGHLFDKERKEIAEVMSAAVNL